ncbi:ATP-grasp domain-containing protein [Anaerovorax odorimutans]|uniref:ATP-grasp domain-containing protein n=1 Tax=Anaerovorax odorimutans TaxID=109327 RepID=A0ABT1RJC5_9FIRM|nr:ATP-grasp domain-containing protein [Anaerovorax odorimutans]
MIGKKLLILGGIRTLCDYVVRAQKMGVYVYVADYDIYSPAKQIADQAVFLDATNVEEIVAFCKKEGIDGITTGYVDILLKPCYEACRRLNLFCYLTPEMIEMSTNKEYFKSICAEYSIPTPISHEIKNEDYEVAALALNYPVFIKPLDASGSRGAAVCNNVKEFKKQYKCALNFSKQKKVVVEEYLSGTEFLMDYLIVDGRPYLLSMFDRIMSADRNSAINHSDLCIAPSCNLTVFQQKIHQNILEMLSGMNFENGLIFFQGFVKDKNITIYEMGCRLGGSFPFIDEHCTGINPMDMLINYALTGEMGKKIAIEEISPHFSELGGVINIMALSSEYRIAEINGIEEVSKLPQMLHYLQRMFIGDSFQVGKITDSPVVSFYFYAKDIDEYKEIVRFIYSKVSVFDKYGNSLLMQPCSIENL